MFEHLGRKSGLHTGEEGVYIAYDTANPHHLCQHYACIKASMGDKRRKDNPKNSVNLQL